MNVNTYYVFFIFSALESERVPTCPRPSLPYSSPLLPHALRRRPRRRPVSFRRSATMVVQRLLAGAARAAGAMKRRTGSAGWRCEPLGTIALKRDLATVKSKKKKGDAADDGSNSVKDKFVKLLNTPWPEKPTYSEEEQQRHIEIGRRYNVETSRRSNADNKEIQCKIKLKEDAMRALPPEILEACRATEKDVSLPIPPTPMYHRSLPPYGMTDL